MSPKLSPKVRRLVATDRCEQKGPEMLPELLPEVRRAVATNYYIEGANNHGLESSGEKALARKEVTASENLPASGGGEVDEGGEGTGESKRS